MDHHNVGIKVILDEELLNKAPKCSHGPTALFERETKHGSKTFYACSAIRDRKLCNFYQLVSEDGIPAKQKQLSSLTFTTATDDNSNTFNKLWKIFKKTPSQERKFCKSCGEPVVNLSKHVGHPIMEGISDELLTRPLTLLEPIKENKGIAQFHFDNKTTQILKGVVKELKVSHVLCIGVPSLFEELLNMDGISSFLLDIDYRLTRLFPRNMAAQYNMFVHHFFDETDGAPSFKSFLSSARQSDILGSRLLVIVDPPFGAMFELLLHGLSKLSKDFFGDDHKGEIVQTLVAFPYFLEEKVKKDKAFKMSDIEVAYKNHIKLRKRKRDDEPSSSVVKFFTNLQLSKLVLPKELGYRFCGACKKYVSQQNKHCSKCKACTTKIGKTYRHCEICRKCVKSSWKHCGECDACELPGRHSKRIKNDDEGEEEATEE